MLTCIKWQKSSESISPSPSPSARLKCSRSYGRSGTVQATGGWELRCRAVHQVTTKKESRLPAHLGEVGVAIGGVGIEQQLEEPRLVDHAAARVHRHRDPAVERQHPRGRGRPNHRVNRAGVRRQPVVGSPRDEVQQRRAGLLREPLSKGGGDKCPSEVHRDVPDLGGHVRRERWVGLPGEALAGEHGFAGCGLVLHDHGVRGD